MIDAGFKRKLTAILSADVAGYSRLMDDDEEATVGTLTAQRSATDDLVQQYRGRIVDTSGDNILAEFTSKKKVQVLILDNLAITARADWESFRN